MTKKLYEIDLAGKSIGEFLEECRSLYDQVILLYARQKIEQADQAIVQRKAGLWLNAEFQEPRKSNMVY